MLNMVLNTLNSLFKIIGVTYLLLSFTVGGSQGQAGTRVGRQQA